MAAFILYTHFMKSTQQQFYYKSNRLQQLRGFCFAAQFGNISHAAKHMGLSHSCVSLQIKALENSLGVKLFDRMSSKVTLSEDGKKLFALALPYVEGIQNLHEEFHQETAISKKTELHVAANSTAKNYLLPMVVRKYVESYPDIYITIHYAEHDEAMKLLQEGVVDLAALPRREHKPFLKTYEYTPIFFCTPSLITRPEHPLAGRRNLSVQEISRYELTLPAEDLRVIADLYDIFPKQNINKKLRVSFVNSETGREYIEAGMAITISSDVWIFENDTLTATALSHLFPSVDYGFVCKRGKAKSDKVRKFINTAIQHAATIKKSRADVLLEA